MYDETNPLGAISRRDALALGVPDAALRRAGLGTPFHGVRTRVLPSTYLDLAVAYRARLRPWQFFTGLTALVIWGAPLSKPLGSDEDLDVGAMAPDRPPRTRGVTGHALAKAVVDVVEHRGFRVTDPASSWVQAAKMLSPRDLLAVADHMVFQPRSPQPERPFCSLDDLRSAVERASSRGVASLNRLLPLISTDAASRPESILRLILHDAGLPACEVNGSITDRGGRPIAIGDLVFREWKVLVEYDGMQHTTSRRQRDRDRVRANDLAIEGWIVVIVHSAGIAVERADTVRRVRDALAAHGWVP